MWCATATAHDTQRFKLERECSHWVTNVFLPKYVYTADNMVPITPSTNQTMMKYESPQAMRFFFSTKVIDNDDDDNTNNNDNNEKSVSRRFAYGMTAVANSYGSDPTTGYKVFEFDKKMTDIVEELSRLLSLTDKFPEPEFEFNSLEIKLYHGKDIFQNLYHVTNETSHNSPSEKKTISNKGNKEVRFHCDLLKGYFSRRPCYGNCHHWECKGVDFSSTNKRKPWNDVGF